MAMTNPFEGPPFVNPNFSAQMTVTDYVTQLFPLFNERQIHGAVQQYTNIGLNTVNDQAGAIMGECKGRTTSECCKLSNLALQRSSFVQRIGFLPRFRDVRIR